MVSIRWYYRSLKGYLVVLVMYIDVIFERTLTVFLTSLIFYIVRDGCANLCVYIYVYIYIYIYVYMYICIYEYIYTYTHVYDCVSNLGSFC